LVQAGLLDVVRTSGGRREPLNCSALGSYTDSSGHYQVFVVSNA
jgi:hypothetical protein